MGRKGVQTAPSEILRADTKPVGFKNATFLADYYLAQASCIMKTLVDSICCLKACKKCRGSRGGGDGGEKETLLCQFVNACCCLPESPRWIHLIKTGISGTTPAMLSKRQAQSFRALVPPELGLLFHHDSGKEQGKHWGNPYARSMGSWLAKFAFNQQI